jgi:hypothetical protein
MNAVMACRQSTIEGPQSITNVRSSHLVVAGLVTGSQIPSLWGPAAAATLNRDYPGLAAPNTADHADRLLVPSAPRGPAVGFGLSWQVSVSAAGPAGAVGG